MRKPGDRSTRNGLTVGETTQSRPTRIRAWFHNYQVAIAAVLTFGCMLLVAHLVIFHF